MKTKSLVTLFLAFAILASVPAKADSTLLIGLSANDTTVTECASPCVGVREDNSWFSFATGYFFNTSVVDIGAELLMSSGVGVSLDLRKRFGDFSVTLAGGAMQQNLNVDLQGAGAVLMTSSTEWAPLYSARLAYGPVYLSYLHLAETEHNVETLDYTAGYAPVRATLKTERDEVWLGYITHFPSITK